MRINKLTIYKTQLGNDYSNVIDVGPGVFLNKQKYKDEVLNSYYSPREIYNGNTLSCKEIEGEMEVSLAVLYEQCVDYNYCCIENGSGYFFYFITGMESLNDNTGKPSTLFHLERDSYANNIEYFCNHNYDDKQLVMRSHWERFYDNGKNRFLGRFLNSDDKTTFTKYADEHFLNVFSGSKYVVWVGFRVSGDAGLKVNDEKDEFVRIGDCSQYRTTGGSLFDSVAPIFYVPLAIITGFEDGWPNYTYSFTVNGHSYSNLLTEIKKRIDFTSSIFMEAFVTIFPPFRYSVSGNAVTVSSVDMINYPLYLSSRDENLLLIWANKAVYDSDSSFYYISCNQQYINKISVAHNYNTPLTSFSPTSSTAQLLWDPYGTYESTKSLDPRIYCSPYYDWILAWGDWYLPINVEGYNTQLQLRIDLSQKTSGTFTVWLGDKIISSYNTIPKQGNLPTSGDKWEGQTAAALNDIIGGAIGGLLGGTGGGGSYSMTHSTTINQPGDVYGRSKFKGSRMKLMSHSDPSTRSVDALSESGSYATGVGGLTGAVKGMVSTASREVEISTIPLHSNQPSSIGSDNIGKQVPRIIYTGWNDVNELEDVLGSMYLYGYTLPINHSVKWNCRVWFDYCQTVDCKLPKITNLRDRYNLENAFNRGVTKWHIQEGFGLNSNFNKTLNNPEKRFVNAEDAQLSFDFTKGLANRGTLGNTLTFNQTSGIELTQYGLKVTAGNTHYAKSNINLANYIPFNARANSRVVQFAISDIDTSTLKSGYGYVAGLHTDNAIFIENGILKINGHTMGTSYPYIDIGNVNSLIGKTITISYYFTGYGIDSKLRVYVDENLVKESGSLGQYTSNFFGSFGCTSSGYTPTITFARYRSYYYPGETTLWDTAAVKTHLFSGIPIPD